MSYIWEIITFAIEQGAQKLHDEYQSRKSEASEREVLTAEDIAGGFSWNTTYNRAHPMSTKNYKPEG